MKKMACRDTLHNQIIGKLVAIDSRIKQRGFALKMREVLFEEFDEEKTIHSEYDEGSSCDGNMVWSHIANKTKISYSSHRFCQKCKIKDDLCYEDFIAGGPVHVVPDAYFVSEDERCVIVFEVVVHHDISRNKIISYRNLDLGLDELSINFILIRIDSSENIAIVDANWINEDFLRNTKSKAIYSKVPDLGNMSSIKNLIDKEFWFSANQVKPESI